MESPTRSTTTSEPLPEAEPTPPAGAVATGFFPSLLEELRKVVWPSRQQLFSDSVAVILMVGLSAASIGAIDRLFGWLSSQIFR